MENAAAVDTKNWHEIGALDEIPRLGARIVRTGIGDIAVFRNRDDQVFALEDRCPHRGGPLSQGIVSGSRVFCPLHDWCIRLTDGGAEPPDEGRVQRYPILIEDGRIYLALEPE